jgi:vitamin B12 transporter
MQKTKLSLLTTLTLIGALQVSAIELDKITVTTPTKSPTPLTSITADVDVITADMIAERGYHTLAQLLKTRAAIQTNSNGGLGQTTALYLRGMDSKYTLVLIDGVRYNDPTTLNGAQFEHILLDNVARIEIVKGPQSGIWGADASAGVINIITKRAEKEGLHANIGAEYGSYNTQTYFLDTTYKRGQYDVALGLERLSSDGFSAKVPQNGDPDDFEDDGYTNNSADLKLGVNVTDQDRVEGFFNYIDADTDYDGYNSDPIQAANDKTASVKSKEQFYGLSYIRTQDKNRYKLYAQRSTFERTYATGFTKAFDGSIDEAGLNGTINYLDTGILTAGIDYKKFTHENEIDNDYTNQAIFITNSNSFDALISGKTIFTQSLRYDKFDDFDNKLTYKVGLKHIHEHIKDFWTSANYATAYNVPTLYHLYGPYGNKDLNPEKTKGFDITANYKGLGITYFQNEVEDLIEYKTTNFETFEGAYFNIDGTSKFKGVEVSYEGSAQALSLAYGFNYTWLKTEDKDGKELPRRAKNSANITLDYYGLERTHIGTTISYVGKRKKSPYDADPTKDYSSYTLVDMTADYQLNDALTLYARVENALDKTYQQISGYATAARSLYAGFRYKLK